MTDWGEATEDGRVRVAYVTNRWLFEGGGGAEKVLFSLASGLNRHVFAPVVIAVAGDGSGAYFDMARGAAIPTRVLSTSLVTGAANAGRNFGCLVGMLRRSRVQIVHSSMDSGVGVLAGAVAGVPVRVLTTHSLHHMPRLLKQVTANVVIRRAATSNVAVSDSVASNLVDAYGASPARVERIFNGVEDPLDGLGTPSSRPAQGPIEARVVFVGRLVACKGVDLLLDAMPLVAERIPSVFLTIVGDGPERSDLEERTLRLGLAAKVRFVGHQASPSSWLINSTVAAVPSRTEGLGMAAIEALACSVPVVCSDAGGLPEVVLDQECGLVVQSSHGRADGAVDPRDFAHALVRVLADRVLAGRLGRNGRQRYEGQFSMGQFIRSHEALYINQLSALQK